MSHNPTIFELAEAQGIQPLTDVRTLQCSDEQEWHDLFGHIEADRKAKEQREAKLAKRDAFVALCRKQVSIGANLTYTSQQILAALEIGK